MRDAHVKCYVSNTIGIDKNHDYKCYILSIDFIERLIKMQNLSANILLISQKFLSYDHLRYKWATIHHTVYLIAEFYSLSKSIVFKYKITDCGTGNCSQHFSILQFNDS